MSSVNLNGKFGEVQKYSVQTQALISRGNELDFWVKTTAIIRTITKTKRKKVHSCVGFEISELYKQCYIIYIT
jgi:hypothetical protein